MTFLRKNSKNIIIGVLFILFIGACITIFYLLNNKKIEISKEIIGEVIIADKEYLIIESNNENYLITNIKGDYEVGDKIKFMYFESEANNEKSPKEIKIRDEELITKNTTDIKNEETNNKENEINNSTNSNQTEENKNQNNNQKPNNNQNSNSDKPNTETSNNNSNKKENADTAVLNYMNNLQTEMDKPSIGETAKKGFITVIDFLFYNGTIKGYRFSELTNSAKLKVLSIALYFDSKIEKYFPGYKESISNTTKKIYTNIKENIISTYLDITTAICANNNDLCTSAKDGFQSLKKNFGLTFDLIKDIAGGGLNNLKNWYEIWSGK